MKTHQMPQFKSLLAHHTSQALKNNDNLMSVAFW
jgi:hypothetical protein